MSSKENENEEQSTVSISNKDYQKLKEYENTAKLYNEKLAELNSTEDALKKREALVSAKEIEAINNFPSLMTKLSGDEAEKREKSINYLLTLIAQNQSLKADLSEEKLQIQIDRNQLSDELRDKKTEFETQLLQQKQTSNEELANERVKRMSQLETEIEKVRFERLAQIDELLKKNIEETNRKSEEELKKKKTDLDALISEYKQKLSDLDIKEKTLTSEQGKLQIFEKELNIRENEIDNRVSELTKERKISYERKELELTSEIDRLREQLANSQNEIDLMKDLEQKLGGKDPQLFLQKLESTQNELKMLRKSLAVTNEEEHQKDLQALNEKIKTLKSSLEQERLHSMTLESSQGNNELKLQITEMSRQNEMLQRSYDSMDKYCKTLECQIERLSAAYGSKKDRDERIRDIVVPLFDDVSELKLIGINSDDKFEINWLDHIIKQSRDSAGLEFPKRIVYAFHTCLKTAEWSPLTVLAGVSGTGKSELPRCYSSFGGLKFLPVAVQPNWDSQEAMLGFFNSIDNKFDTQPVLRFLAQSTMKKTDDYPNGLRDSMNLILLDEMNLAHVELYFADFLSKLETRRGKDDGNLPYIDVKLGAGITPYQLELTRNVMWVGTMNQDETTKSLSDKVLDRGNIIFFPRPRHLKSRNVRHSFKDLGCLISESLWKSFIVSEALISEEQIKPFKDIVEKINDAMACVGRALGHRVWQSIEYYMNNYPTIIGALRNPSDNIDENQLKEQLRLAFEDALVQKVMPKLRGIETSGSSKTQCLDKIKTILTEGVFNKPLGLISDFNLSCENPFGQFIWNSANYILDSEKNNK